jgi:large subunit ribosomal protein L23
METLRRKLFTEKASKMEDKNVYSFIVDRKATKSQIKKDIEDQYGVKVVEVNTCVYGRRRKAFRTRLGYTFGAEAAYKKAYVKFASL